MPRHFEVRAHAPGFVAEVTGLRLDRALADDVVEAIRETWTDYPVVVFPDQPLDHAALTAFSNRLGAFGVDPYLKAVPGYEHIIEVCREPRESTPIFGANWHSDWSFQRTPPSATLLHAKTVPPSGGDTLFADCYRAYAALSPQLKATLADLSAVHSAAPAYGPRGLFARDDPSRSMQIEVSPQAEHSEIHPIVRTHPRSGRKSLFINHVYTLAISGMQSEASRELLDSLFEHMTSAKFVYRHQWRPNMLVVWDNRCVVHYAEGGYAGHRRIMHRTTLAGERPA